MQHYARCGVGVSSGLRNGLVAVQLPEQTLGVERAFCRGQFQPVTSLLRFIDGRLGTEPTVFELGVTITSTSCLAQQLMAYTTIPGISAITAKHLPKPALRNHYATARRHCAQAA